MKRILEVGSIVVLFIGINMFAHAHEATLLSLAKDAGSLGIALYVATTAIAIIVPVWSNMFLMPIASIMWGPFSTALLSILGWLIGSHIAFVLGRVFGESVKKAFPKLLSSNHVTRLVSKKHPNLSLIFLRMTIPVDILSYGLGLFAHQVTVRQNFFTTLVGVVPFAFLFSYFNDIPKMYSIGILSVTTLLFIIYSSIMLRKK
jgi:uncharacterized membrane protein YdjX (TVP38/TMEM64 family)